MKMNLLMVVMAGFCLDAPAQEPKERANRDAHGEVLCMAITDEGQTLASGTWDRVTLWNAATGKELYTLKREIGCVAFSPDAKVLASGSRDMTIKFWDVATGKELRTLSGHTGRIASLAFSPDGKTLASGSWDDTIKIWDTGTGKELRTLAGLGGRRSVAFSSDGRTLASDHRRTVILWDLDLGKERFALKGHQESVFAVAFAPDGKTLASGGDDFNVKLWDAVTDTELRTLKGHTDAIGSLAFAPDGKTLASGSNDGTVKVWDVATGRERATLRPKSDPKANRVHSVVFMPDGKTLVLGIMDGTVRLWDVASPMEQPPVVKSAAPAPDLDALFNRADGWIGADGAYSVALSPKRTLWLFSDTWIGKIRDGRRTDATIVNNTVGVQEGVGGRVTYSIARGPDGKPAALIVPADRRGWFWLQAGVADRGRLSLFLNQVEKTDDKSVFGFRSVGLWLGTVADADQPPESWRVEQVRMPNAVFSEDRMLAWGAAALRVGNDLYVYGTDEQRGKGLPNRQMVVARVPAASVGVFAAWRYFREGLWGEDFRNPSPLADGIASEYSSDPLQEPLPRRVHRTGLVAADHGPDG